MRVFVFMSFLDLGFLESIYSLIDSKVCVNLKFLFLMKMVYQQFLHLQKNAISLSKSSFIHK